MPEPNDKIYNGYVIDGFTMSIAQLFGSGPSLTIECSKCHCRYNKRIKPSHRPVVRCSICGVANRLDITT